MSSSLGVLIASGSSSMFNVTFIAYFKRERVGCMREFGLRVRREAKRQKSKDFLRAVLYSLPFESLSFTFFYQNQRSPRKNDSQNYWPNSVSSGRSNYVSQKRESHFVGLFFEFRAYNLLKVQGEKNEDDRLSRRRNFHRFA